MSLAPGTRLGRFEIRSRLGAGGMGEVYLGHDTQLRRAVALKILTEEFTASDDRLRRFEQEARAASALNHPNIITIHEIGKTDELDYIVTEFVEGESLRDHMKGERLRLVELLDVAIQIASALSAAHEAGIVHRDIKPENIMVRPDGIVKVLDFGLAKLTPNSQTDEVDTEAATRAIVNTGAGVIMGTARYMSPEQARGAEQVDARTDIWSLGCVLYEMATGRAPFEGATPTEIIARIIEREPQPVRRHAPQLPAEFERIVTKALTKEPSERYQTARDLLVDLRRLKQRLEVETEIEREVRPETQSGREAAASGASMIAHAVDEAAATISTKTVAAHPTSSAEYLVNEIKRHKRGAALAASALLLFALLGFGYFYFLRNARTPIDSIAVLPFVNQNNDPETEYLSDGLAESIINNLTQLPSLRVSPRSTVFRYKGKETDPLAVGRELNVRAVLTGRVFEHGDNLIINVELVDVRDNKEIWGERYDRKIADALAVQREIAGEISQRLRAELTGDERRKLVKGSTNNPDAYQLYLKGNYYASKYTKDGLQKGIDYFNQAIALDPNYALAYNGLAYYYIAAEDWYLSPNDSMPKAREAAQKALAIDESLADAHASLGVVASWYDWDWATADREYRRAIELDANNPRSHEYYAWYLVAVGRVDEAVAEAKRAQQLDPVAPETNMFLGSVLTFGRRYDEAIEALRAAVELDPTYWTTRDFLGRAYEAKGRLNEAITEFERARELEDDVAENWSNLGHAYALSGRQEEAKKILEHLKEMSAHAYVPAYAFASVYAGLGDKEQTFKWLERAYADRSVYMIWFKNDWQMDALRSDPRHADLLRRLKLQP